MRARCAGNRYFPNPLGSLLHQKVLRYNNVSLPSTIMMRIDKHNLCTLCGEARLRFKSKFDMQKPGALPFGNAPGIVLRFRVAALKWVFRASGEVLHWGASVRSLQTG